MEVNGLDGKTYTLKLVRKNNTRSAPHQKAYEILRILYPHSIIYEEVPIPKSKLRIDLYLPVENLAVEVQGQQHETYNEHFHKNKMGYLRSKQRDLNKKEWCELNNITLVRLYKDDDWTNKLRRENWGN